MNVEADMGRPAPPMDVERRKGERRVDKHTSRLVTKAFCLYRVFGLKTALSLLHRTGFGPIQARRLLIEKYDRRRVAGPARNAHAAPESK